MTRDFKDDQFELNELKEEELEESPYIQFEKWFSDAESARLIHPNAFTLATTGDDGRPSARMLLMKGFDSKGFIFYTNSESKKGDDLSGNQSAAMCFWWGKLERQVRIDGEISIVDGDQADAYFSSRPRGSQIGAWASPQSSVIESRDVLEEKYKEIEKRYEGQEIPRPPYWQGYILSPQTIEFWQGRPDRLHDRFRYKLHTGGKWVIERLAP